jgi:hypothetical protein
MVNQRYLGTALTALTEKTLKTACIDKILEKSSVFLKENCIITGGHFRMYFSDEKALPVLNEGTIQSFEYAVRLFLLAKEGNLKAEIGILINDMGYSCEEDICRIKTPETMRKDYELPDQYRKILTKNRLENYPVKIFWEKHIRNRGKKWLIKLLKDGSKKCENYKPGRLDFCRRIEEEKDAIFLNDAEGYGKIILTKIHGRDKYGTPACPLIMAAFAKEQSRFYATSINFYYTGEDNLDNIPNHFVIEKGKRVCEIFGCSMEIKNFYFA